MRRRWPIPLLAVLAVLITADIAAWIWAEARLRAGLDAWIATTRADGAAITTGAPQRGGWPLSARLSVPDLRLAYDAARVPGGLVWQAERVELRLALATPRRLVVAVEGAQTLRIAALPALIVRADRFEATLPLPQQPARDVDLAASAVEVAPAAAPGSRVTLATLRGAVAADGRAWRLEAATIGLPGGYVWPLGSRIETASFDAHRQGPAIAVDRGALRWGPLGLTATGTLALDQSLQPAAAGTARVEGYAATLDALADGHVIGRPAAVAAKAVLALLARAPDDGGPNAVEIPFSLRDGLLSLDDVPMLRLPTPVLAR